MEYFLGQLALFPFPWAPRGLLKCEGQLLPISQYTALFSLMGTIYGGDGRTTFALPDLRGRAVVSEGQGPGLQRRTVGERLGRESVTLTSGNLPSQKFSIPVSEEDATTDDPNGNVLATGGSYAPANTASGSLGGGISSGGGNQPFDLHQPTLVMSYCICINGIFPSRS